MRIAAGLAEGLTYTEIARGLGRPVSTISREVVRNGGPGDYQTDRAHEATVSRARRHKPVPVPPTASDAGGRDPKGALELEQRFTALIARTGLPGMAARVLACLYTCDSGSLTAAELVQRLRASPASVSKAVGLLKRLELIRCERDSQRRRDRYIIDADAWYRSWMSCARRLTALADLNREGAEILGDATPAGARMRDMGEFFGHVSQDMIRVAEHWWQVFFTGWGAEHRAVLDRDTP